MKTRKQKCLTKNKKKKTLFFLKESNKDQKNCSREQRAIYLACKKIKMIVALKNWDG